MTSAPVVRLRCGCPGCFRGLNQGMAFCREHWDLLPRALRDGLYAAQRRPERAASTKLAAVQWLEQSIQRKTEKTMQPHEQRVVDEKRDLDEKLVKLTQFISASDVFKGLDPYDCQLLRDQQSAMMQYSDLLGERITRFPK